MRHDVVNKFNRGEIEPEALGREDVERIRNTAEEITNFLPIRLGPMRYRQGMEYLDTVPDDAYCVPFIAATDDTAILEFTDALFRVWISDAVLIRTSVTSTITNPTFTGSLAGWTDNSGAGSSTSWDSSTAAAFLGAGTTRAELYQTITADTGNEHTLRIVNSRGPIDLRLGTSGVGSTEILAATTLPPGTHTLVFTPAANFTITFSSSLTYSVWVSYANFDGAVDFSTATDIAEADLPSIRYAQSADVVFLTRENGKPLRIERRGAKSWSVVDFLTEDGPFEAINASDITLTPSALNGDVTLTASEDFFKSEHVGALFKVTSSGQVVTASVSAQDNGTGGIRVTGVGSARSFSIEIAGTFVATVTLQRSADNVVWEDTSSTWTAPVATSFDDLIDNAILYYRLHVKTGDFTSGTVELDMVYASGSIDGIARVVTYTSVTVVSAVVLQDFGSTDASRNWYEGSWSDHLGHPTAVALYEGRLFLAGSTKIWGSVSDAFTSFDRLIEGDSKSILRTIGFGPVDSISWLVPSTRLMMGTASAEISVRSSSFGEPLTQDNSNLKAGSTQGVGAFEALQIDDAVVFVQRSGTKIYSASYNVDRDTHKPIDLTLLNQTICSAGIKRIAVSREPETRIWVVLDDGEARVYLLDDTEEVAAWSRIVTDGTIEDVVVLPGTSEDRVYFVVSRTGGRYMEKMALTTEAAGGSTSKHTDSFLKFTNPGTTITVAHLDTKTVNVWADGQDRGSFTVASNDITVGSSWTNVVVGLAHTADWKSNKISNYISAHTLNTRKRIVDVALIMRNYAPTALKLGPSVALLEIMPEIEDGTDVDTTATVTDYDELPFEFNGEEESDPRIFMRATGPCTVMALSYGVMHGGDAARTTTTEG